RHRRARRRNPPRNLHRPRISRPASRRGSQRQQRSHHFHRRQPCHRARDQDRRRGHHRPVRIENPGRSPSMSSNPSPELLSKMEAYWRAANYLSVGQIYLRDNPLLREPLQLQHVKPRLLGHWGTTPGLNFVYVHANRVIKARDLNAIYVAGPGHGGPGVVANAYLEGTYSEIYPSVSRDV